MTDDHTDEPTGFSEEPAEEPAEPAGRDLGLMARLTERATRPIVGWALVALGTIAILVGYFGVSREILVAKQMPYLVSGGIGGMVMVAVGAFLLGTDDLRGELGRLHRIERQLNELHQVLLVPLEEDQQTTAPPTPASAPAAAASAPASTPPADDPWAGPAAEDEPDRDRGARPRRARRVPLSSETD